MPVSKTKRSLRRRKSIIAPLGHPVGRIIKASSFGRELGEVTRMGRVLRYNATRGWTSGRLTT